MRATGIVRRIDELGRVVIPKEIRRTLRIREGDPLEIFLSSDGELTLKKYSALGELEPLASSAAKALNRTTGLAVVICTRDEVVASVGVGAKGCQPAMAIHTDLYELLSSRRSAIIDRTNSGEPIGLVDGRTSDKDVVQIIVPIEADGEIVGGVVLLSSFMTDGQTLASVDMAAHAIAHSLGQQAEN